MTFGEGKPKTTFKVNETGYVQGVFENMTDQTFTLEYGQTLFYFIQAVAEFEVDNKQYKLPTESIEIQVK